MLAIDAGHGGSDPGCHWPPVGELEFVEKEVTLNIAKRTHALIPESTLIRAADNRVLLSTRAHLAHERLCTHALIIHCDAISKSEVHGMRIYVLPGTSIATAWAYRIIDGAPAALKSPIKNPMFCTDNPGDRDDWLKRARACLLPYHSLGIDAVLVECGFSTNEADREYLLSENGQKNIAELFSVTT